MALVADEEIAYMEASWLERLVPDHENFYKNLRPDFSVQQSAEHAGNLHQVVEYERKAGREKMGQISENLRGRVLVPDHENFYKNLRPDFSVQRSAEHAGNLHQVVEYERKAGREKMGQISENLRGRVLVPDHENFYKNLRPDFSVQQSAEHTGNLHQVVEYERKAGREKMGQISENLRGRVLVPEFEAPYMRNLEAFLSEERRKGAAVYPPFGLIFNAFCQTPFDQVNVVIMGQDPYHGPGQAHGLSFSVPKGIAVPPSLLNIYKEIHSDLGLPMPSHGCLLRWAKQGVLLLNATLTVRAGEAKSHHGQGWEMFTDRVVQLLCERKDPLVFLLWGKSALDKFQHICGSGKHHLVLTAPHPSPLSAHTGFLGCRHFSKTNEFLKKLGKKIIDWSIE